MNKTKLREDFIAKGYTVNPVEQWRKVATIDNKTKYDANFIAPGSTDVDTAYIIVEDDEAASENVIQHARIDEPEAAVSFAAEVRTFLDTKEGGTVFAIRVLNETLSESDQVAEAVAYMTDNTTAKYVIKKRNNTFSFQATA